MVSGHSDSAWRREVAEGGAVGRRAAALRNAMACFGGDGNLVADCWDDFAEAALAAEANGSTSSGSASASGPSPSSLSRMRPVIKEWVRLGGAMVGGHGDGSIGADAALQQVHGTALQSEEPLHPALLEMAAPAWVALPAEPAEDAIGKGKGKAKAKPKGKGKGKDKKGGKGADVDEEAAAAERAAALVARGDPMAGAPTLRAVRSMCSPGHALDSIAAAARAAQAQAVTNTAVAMAGRGAGMGLVAPHLLSAPPVAVRNLASTARDEVGSELAMLGGQMGGVAAGTSAGGTQEGRMSVSWRTGGEHGAGGAEGGGSGQGVPLGGVQAAAAAWRLVDAVRRGAGGSGGGPGDATLLEADEEAAAEAAGGGGGGKGKGGKKKK